MKRKNFKRVISGIAAMSLLASVGAVNVMADSTLAASVYADDNGVVLDFSQAIENTADLSGIELYKAGVKADGFTAAVEADGDVVLTGAVERNAMYTVKVPAGFVDGSSAIEKKFVVKEVFSENFDSTENGKLPSTIVGTAGGSLSVQNGEMQHTDGSFYLDYTGKNYTVSYDVKAYQTSSGTKATEANKYAGDTAPGFMRLLYNVGSKTTSFTKQGCYSMSLRNHEASRADVMRISRGGTKWNGSGWSFNDGNSDYTQAYVDYPHSPAYGVTSNAAVPLSVITDADAPQAAAFKLTSRKIANDIDLYVDGAHAANYIGGARTATNDILTEGYFGVQEGFGGKCASVYDNISITACFEPTNTEVTDIYADAYGVYLTFGADVTDITDTAGITLTDSKGDSVPFTVSGKGKTLTLSAALSSDVYSVSVGEGFGGGVIALENEYTKQFKVKEVALADSDFKGATVENGVVTIAKDGQLTLLKGNDKKNYTLSFKLNVEGQRKPNLRMWYNAQNIGTFHDKNNRAYVLCYNVNEVTFKPCANAVFNSQDNVTITHANPINTDGSRNVSLRKMGRNSDMYVNGTNIASFTPNTTYTVGSNSVTYDETGYFGIWNVSHESNSGTSTYVTLSDVKLTYFAEYDPKPMTVSGWYADKEGVIVTFDKDMSDISADQLSKVSVTENGEEIAIESIKADGGKVVIETKEELKNNTVYDVELEKGFGTESFVLTDKFLAQFKLTEKFYEDFSDSVFDGGIVAGTAAKDKQYEGAFYLWADTMYIKDTKNYASYTLSFDLKSYSTKKTNDEGVETTEAAPMYFRPFFTGEDKFFTACEAYVWGVTNKADSVLVSRGGPKYDETTQTWSGYDGTKYNVNGQNDIYSKSLNYGKLTADAAGAPYSIDTETAGSNVVTVRKNGTLAQLYFDGGYASSLNLPSSFETCYFGVQNGQAGQKAYIIDNVRLTVCEPVTSTVRALKLTVNDADGNKLESLSGISYAKGEVTVKNYTDGEKPVVCVVAAYDEHNKLLAANIIEIENGKLAKKSSQTKPYELKSISGVKEISVFCWDSFDTIVPYCSAVTVK